jgi:hypothetical protein
MLSTGRTMDPGRNRWDAVVELNLYVEGGGDSKLLRTACRRGFSEFLTKAGLQGHMPRIVACGGRKQAYDDFCIALRRSQPVAMLLVDSEDAVKVSSPWAHLLQRTADAWPMPPDATDGNCHMMVQCMETWLLADRNALMMFFGQGYAANALPAEQNAIEAIPKVVVYQALANATKDCKTKAPYGKGEHSFKLLALIDPAKVMAASPWANRFVTGLKKTLEA